jgi:tetratricopeptide (TPR) repeat protein
MLGALVYLVVSSVALPASAVVAEDHPDASAIATLGIDAPQALPLMEAGDAAMASGKFSEAAELFDRSAHLSPKSGMLRRKQCEALAGAGKRQDALKACQRAYELGSRSTFDARKMVAVRVAGRQLPTPLEAYQAYDMASFAIRSDSGEPWGYAAMCDVAHRLGDSELFARSLWQLKTIAPRHPELSALEQLVAEQAARARLGRLLLLLLLLGTGAHWLVGRFKRVAPTAPVSRAPTS